MKLALIDYGSGNLRSAAQALARAASDLGSALEIAVTDRPEAVAAADRIVLPGVGAFADCLAGLAARDGLIDAMAQAVLRAGRPFLGICVGMQLLAQWGLEHGRHAGLGWLPGEVRRLAPADPALKVPHLGWNSLSFCRPHALTRGLPEGADVYFVHSYALYDGDPADLVALTGHGGPIAALVARGPIAGTQFHPEKSQGLGLRLLTNFLTWKP